MKKIVLSVCIIGFLSSCSIFRKEKYGCPASASAIGAEKLAEEDPKAMKKAKKSKFRGGSKGFYR